MDRNRRVFSNTFGPKIVALLKTFLGAFWPKFLDFFAGIFSTKIVDFFKDFLIKIGNFFKDISQLTFWPKILDVFNFFVLLGLKSMFLRIYLGETSGKEIVEEIIVDFKKKFKALRNARFFCF